MMTASTIDDLRQTLDQSAEDMSPEEAAGLYHRLGAHALEAGNLTDALGHFDMALLGDPGHLPTLRALTAEYDAARRDRRWPDAAACLQRLIDEASSAERLAPLHYAMGMLQRRKLGDPNAAVQSFEACLSNAPDRLKAFEEIDRILTEHKAWDRLEAAYRLMLKRIRRTGVGGGDLQAMLWRNLGEIYRTRLRRFGEAATAFEQAARLSSDDSEIHEIVADLHLRAGDPINAVAAHHEGVRRSPLRTSHYRALAKLYGEMDRPDEAWCVAAAMVFMGEADDALAELYEAHRPPTPPQPETTVDHDLWVQAIVHPLDDLRVGNVFAKLAEVNPFAANLAALELTEEDRLDPYAPTAFNQAFHAACHLLQLGAAAPDVYRQGGAHVGLTNGNTQPWSMIAGLDVLASADPQEQAFRVGRQLSLYRLEHYLAGLGLPTERLKLLFFSACKVTSALAHSPDLGDPQALEDMIVHLGERIPGAFLVDLYETISALVSHTTDINLSRWVRGVEHTANRVGLLLCGDLATAARLTKAEPHPISKADPTERVKELVLYAVSPEYFHARKTLGLTIPG